MDAIDFEMTRRAALPRIAYHERMAEQWRRLLATLGEERDNGRPVGGPRYRNTMPL